MRHLRRMDCLGDRQSEYRNDRWIGYLADELRATIQSLNSLLRGWAAYFKLTQTKRTLEEREGWIRHKLRCILWRQKKRSYARARMLIQRGLTDEQGTPSPAADCRVRARDATPRNSLSVASTA